ncbi:MAG: glycosyltransferase [Motilibacteraceae bacterium]
MKSEPRSEQRKAPVLVSVVIPTYNAAHMIGEQLGALRRQTYSGAFEVIVSDNGSTDDLCQAVERAGVVGLGVRVVDASGTKGVSHARNVGLQAARGELICICDADDMVGPEWLSSMVAAAQRADLVAGALVPHPANSLAALSGRDRSAWTRPARPRGARWPYAYGCNLSVWTDVARQVGGWDEGLAAGGDDVDFSWRVQAAGYSFGHCAEAVVAYRLREGLLPLMRQMHGYGRAMPALAAKHGAAVYSGWAARDLLGAIWWLASRAPVMLLNPRRRARWVGRLGHTAGVLSGRRKVARRNVLARDDRYA